MSSPGLDTSAAIGGASEPLLPTMLPVVKRRRQTGDTFDLVLDTSARGGLSFRPGQFNMLSLFGVGESAISISSDPGQAEQIVHTIRAVGTVTRALSRLAPGDLVGVRGPFGQPWPLEQARGKDVLLVAGGIGLAPLKPVLHALLHDRAAYGSITLAYGARTPLDILFRKELAAWRRRLDLGIEVTVDRGDPAWRGHTGVVTKLLNLASDQARSTVAFLCGPEVMMRFAALDLARRGMPAEQVFLSTERNMKCAVGFCGHCQLAQYFVCKDGPVLAYAKLASLLPVREI